MALARGGDSTVIMHKMQYKMYTGWEKALALVFPERVSIINDLLRVQGDLFFLDHSRYYRMRTWREVFHCAFGGLSPSPFPWFSWEVCPKFSLCPLPLLCHWEMVERRPLAGQLSKAGGFSCPWRNPQKKNEGLFSFVRITGWTPQHKLWGAFWSGNFFLEKMLLFRLPHSWLSEMAVIFSGRLASHHRLLVVMSSPSSHGILGWEPVYQARNGS